MKPYTFYVIVTPNTLTYLKFAIWSLNKRKDMSLILVANGLQTDEQIELFDFSNQLACGFLGLRTEHMLSHGEALNQLLKTHDEEWFAFCDSDIVSVSDTSHDIPTMGDLKAFSSCEAMFWQDDDVKGVLGRCNQWPDGSLNLTSFFCIYHTETIKEIAAKYGIGFQNIKANLISCDGIKNQLRSKGLTDFSRKLDTGKALTIGLEMDNHAIDHWDIPSLLHIGGLSCWMLYGEKELIHEQYTLSDMELCELVGESSWLYNPKAFIDKENRLFYLRRQQRLAAARYCFQLISHHMKGTPPPRHDLTDTKLKTKLNQLESVITSYVSQAA